MGKLKIVTYNVNGLNENSKMREVFYHLHQKKYDIVLMQETHCIKNKERLWSSTWGSQIWFDNGESNARGVAVLFSKQCEVNVHTVIRSGNGRYLIIYLTINNTKILVANIYAPNQDRPEFFMEAFNKITKFTPSYFIVGGDLNLGLDSNVDRYGEGHNNDKAARWLVNFLSTENFVDVWRWSNPDKNGFTWRKLRPKPAFSRLDYFLVSEPFTQFIQRVDIKPGFRTDHSMVEMNIKFDCAQRGPGYWKFNVSLLNNMEYIECMNKLLEIEMENVKLGEYRNKWELIKLAIRGSTIQFSARKSKSDKNKMDILEKKLKRLELELVNKSPIFMDSEEQIRLVKVELLKKEKTKGAIIRAKANLAFLGEKSTRYFLKLEKQNCVSKTLYRVVDDLGQELTDQRLILNEIKRFYSNLYTTKGPIDRTYVEKLVIPQIPEELKVELNQTISLTEVSNALKDMKHNKSPGCDGLPVEFYKVFYGKIKNFLLGLFHKIVNEKELHLSAK